MDYCVYTTCDHTYTWWCVHALHKYAHPKFSSWKIFTLAALLPAVGFLFTTSWSPVLRPTPAVLRASSDGVAACAGSASPKAAEKTPAHTIRHVSFTNHGNGLEADVLQDCLVLLGILTGEQALCSHSTPIADLILIHGLRYLLRTVVLWWRSCS